MMKTLFKNVKKAMASLLEKYKVAMSLYGEALIKGRGFGCA